jgi:endo-1,4-beta-xylanase
MSEIEENELAEIEQKPVTRQQFKELIVVTWQRIPKVWRWAGLACLVIFATIAVILTLAQSAVINTTATAGRNSDAAPAAIAKPKAAANDRGLLASGWNYLPGASATADGLHISHRGFAIVEQDGSGGQSNPPVNEYGTRLNVTGNFVVKAKLQNVNGIASIQLYGSPPQVSDEFRVETPSVRLTVDGSSLGIRVWSGNGTSNLADQLPVISNTNLGFSPAANGIINLELDEQNNRLSIIANGKNIATVSDQKIFKSGQVWFGADAENSNGSFTIAGLSADSLSRGSVVSYDVSAEPARAVDPNGLQSLAQKKRAGFLIGSDAAVWAAASSSSYNKMLFGGNFGMITPENAMKWQFSEPQPGVYDFHEADALVAMAQKNGMQVWGHNLVFSEALPKWVQTLPTATPAQKAYVQQVMVNHIDALVTHFKGKVKGWDVVNEPIADYDSNGDFNDAQPLRNNVFYRAMGANYINIALNTAHSADPEALMGINDWGFGGLTNSRANPGSNSYDDRAAALYKLLNNLKAQGAPIQIFGDEAHIYDAGAESDDYVDANGSAPVLAKAIDDLAALGIKYRISEADAPQYADDGASYDGSSQAGQFTGELKTCLAHSSCIAMSFWSTGMTDIWQDDNHALQTENTDSPWNYNNNPVQPAYGSLQNTLR